MEFLLLIRQSRIPLNLSENLAFLLDIFMNVKYNNMCMILSHGTHIWCYWSQKKMATRPSVRNTQFISVYLELHFIWLIKWNHKVFLTILSLG